MASADPTTISGLKSIVRQGLEVLCNEPRNLALFRGLLADTIHIQHHSDEPTTDPELFVANFQKLAGLVPDFHMDIIDMVAEVDEGGRGGRVWVYSKITGNEGKHQVDSVDMMTVDRDGKIVASQDVQRGLLSEEGSRLF